MIEHWKPIAGFEGRYEVSDLGQVRSVSRQVISMGRSKQAYLRRIKSKIQASHTWGAKYPGVALVHEDGTKTRFMVHRLVAQAFIPNPSGYAVVNHLDSDTFNCRAGNLEWCDTSRNVTHSYGSGKRKLGSEHHFSFMPRDAAGHVVSSEKKITPIRSEDQSEENAA